MELGTIEDILSSWQLNETYSSKNWFLLESLKSVERKKSNPKTIILRLLLIYTYYTCYHLKSLISS